jgi:hypothetical protein
MVQFTSTDENQDPGLREEFDKRQVTTVATGACFLCVGWGYPQVDIFPEKREGKWAIRVQAKACTVCGGSGLNPKRHTRKQVQQGRAYHKERLHKLVVWTAKEMERMAEEKK